MIARHKRVKIIQNLVYNGSYIKFKKEHFQIWRHKCFLFSRAQTVLKIVFTLHIKTEIPNLSTLCEQYSSFQLWLPISLGKSSSTTIIHGPSLLLSHSHAQCIVLIFLHNMDSQFDDTPGDIGVKDFFQWITALGSVENQVWQSRSKLWKTHAVHERILMVKC